MYTYLSNRYGSLGRAHAQYSSPWSHKVNVAQGRTARLVVPFTAQSSVHDARATYNAKMCCVFADAQQNRDIQRKVQNKLLALPE